MLTKLTCRGRTFELAVDRARRAVAEFRIRGVATNIPFLQAVLDDPDFRAGRVTTSFIEQHPQLLTARSSADRGTRLLHYLADVTVNKPHGDAPTTVDPASKLPSLAAGEPPDGSRQRLLAVGAEAFAAELRHQTRGRRHRHDDARCPPVLARDPGAHPRPGRRRSAHRGAHPAAAVGRVLGRGDLRRRAALPLRGPVGAAGTAARGAAQRLPPDAAARPQHGRLHAVPDRGDRRLRRRGGRDRHRHLPDLRRAQRRRADACGHRRGAGDAVRGRRGRAVLHRRPEQPRRAALHPRLLPRGSPSGSSRPARTCWRSRTWRACCERRRRARSSRALRERFDLPVHLHTHDTPGGQLATLLAAIDAGVDAVDAASAALAGTTSQPALSALVGATDQTDRATGLSLAAVCDLEPYWEATRRLYAPFEAGLPAPTGRVYRHEIPGGQLSNLRQQAIALGLGEKFEQIEDMYAAANDILGNIVKVTPSSKVVGDLALRARRGRRRPAGVRRRPRVVRRPGLGDRLPVRRARRSPRRLAGAVPHQGARGPHRPSRARRSSTPRTRQRWRPRPSFDAEPAAVPRADQGLRRLRASATATSRCCRRATSSTASTSTSSTTSTSAKGVRLILGVESVSPPDERGIRTVMCTINGQLRPVSVRDRSVSSDAPAQERADTSVPGQVGAPFDGVVSVVVVGRRPRSRRASPWPRSRR